MARRRYLTEGNKNAADREESNGDRLGWLLLRLDWGTIPTTPRSTNENTRNGHSLLEIADFICDGTSKSYAQRTDRSG